MTGLLCRLDISRSEVSDYIVWIELEIVGGIECDVGDRCMHKGQCIQRQMHV
jgi:hypothetical protein